MQVNTNYNMAAVPLTGRKAVGNAGSAPPGETAAFGDTAALNQALASSPDVRPQEVSRARDLIADVNYPPPEGIRKISNLLAMNIASENGQTASV